MSSIRRVKSTLRSVMPAPLRRLYAKAQLKVQRRVNSRLSTQQVFAAIYSNGDWGDGDQFDSGSGSRPEVAAPYVELVRRIIAENGVSRVVDLGCGDFRVASGLVGDLDSYVGVDVVPQLITRNQEAFATETVNFRTLDAATEALPDADLCLVRQVLQHLSNSQIEAILKNCERFPLVLITEHYPTPTRARRPNMDKPHGGDTRIPDGSWVDVTAVPFQRRDVHEVLVVEAPRPMIAAGETIRSFLWTPGCHSVAGTSPMSE